MRRRVIRANHALLTLVGLVLLLGGAYLVGRNRGWLPRQSRHDRLYVHAESHWIAQHNWIWAAVAAGAVVVGLLALRWLLIQPRIDRLRRLRVEDDPHQRGRTVLPADVLTDAIEDAVTAYPGVHRARALLTGGSRRQRELVLRVQAAPGSDLVAIRDRVLDEAVPDVRVALDQPDLPVQVHLLVAGKPRSETRVVQ